MFLKNTGFVVRRCVTSIVASGYRNHRLKTQHSNLRQPDTAAELRAVSTVAAAVVFPAHTSRFVIYKLVS